MHDALMHRGGALEGTVSFYEQHCLPAPSGARLNLYVKRPKGTPRAVVQINHGFAEHAGRYARFADHISARGVVAYAHDHRGHGLTTAPGAPLGRFADRDGVRLVLADVDAVHAMIRREHPGVPVVIFGHSMGGLIALNYMLHHSPRLAAAAIWNANTAAGMLARVARAVLLWEKFRLGSDVPSRLLPQLTFRAWSRVFDRDGRSADWLSRDEAEVESYMADPLCGWDASVSMWLDVFAMMLAAKRDRAFARVRRDLPIHLVGGEEDPATEGGKTVLLLLRQFERMRFSNLSSTIYADTRHEGLNEINRNVIMADFMGWLDRVLAEPNGRRAGVD